MFILTRFFTGSDNSHIDCFSGNVSFSGIFVSLFGNHSLDSLDLIIEGVVRFSISIETSVIFESFGTDLENIRGLFEI